MLYGGELLAWEPSSVYGSVSPRSHGAPICSISPHVCREDHNEALCPEELWDDRKASGLAGVTHTQPEGAAVGQNIPLSREKHPR